MKRFLYLCDEFHGLSHTRYCKQPEVAAAQQVVSISDLILVTYLEL
jgi:hypothetical protein